MTAPGWYPDPSGEGQRYWDGKAWGPPAPAPAAPSSTRPKWLIPAVIGGLFLALVIIGNLGGHDDKPKPSAAGGSSTPHTSTRQTFSPAYIERTVTDTCQASVRKSLKDPDSAKFDEWKAWQVTSAKSAPPPDMEYNPAAGDRYYNAAGMVNARNSFGGYTGGQPYSCEAVVTEGGHVNARAHELDLSGLTGGG